MKKNIMMRISAVLLLAVLLTTCVISGTWAKYVSSGTATDSARVAKWGVEVTVTGNEAFAKSYDSHIDGNGTTVISVTSDQATPNKVLAPGTKGNLGSLSIEGKPEVKVQVDISLAIALENWTITIDDTPTFYCPLVFKLDDQPEVVGTNYTSAADLEAAIQNLVKASYAVNANTDLHTSHTITWSWAFDGDDAKDTKLGNLATAPTISAEWVVKVTQVD